MSVEFFGHERTVQPSGQILVADFAALHLQNLPLALIQNAQMGYQRQVATHFEAGTANLYYVMGRSSGTLQGTRFVGRGGVWAGLDSGSACGTLSGVAINIRGDVAGCSINRSQTISMDGVVLTGVGLTFGAAQLEVADNFACVIASVRRDATF